jgi:putative ABC transport system permease protein
MLQGGFKLAAGNETRPAVCTGVTPAMFKIRNWKVDQGSIFSEATCAPRRAWW